MYFVRNVTLCFNIVNFSLLFTAKAYRSDVKEFAPILKQWATLKNDFLLPPTHPNPQEKWDIKTYAK